jgi:endonuclease/exonuclease/phosphatase family metal-dependent hydrolase
LSIKTLPLLAFFLFISISLSFGGEIVRVASYNVKNYLIMERLVSGRWQENYPKPEIENGIIRSIIRRVNPEVLALQEIGGREFLNELWFDLNSSGIGNYRFSHWIQGESDEQRHLALLSRIPFEVKDVFKELEFSYFGSNLRPRRGLMEVKFVTNGKTWRLFNLHLKSKWTEREEDPQASSLREKEARAIRDYIRQRYPPETNPVHLVVGDFNDFKNSAAIRRFQKVNKSIFHHMLPCKDTMGYFWTHYYKKQDSYDRLDYIFVSPSMFENYIKGSARVNDSLRCLEGSDHRMVYADFEF